MFTGGAIKTKEEMGDGTSKFTTLSAHQKRGRDKLSQYDNGPIYLYGLDEARMNEWAWALPVLSVTE